ncbi:MAG: prenyltransferase/squalene oxidase repeat-containing protein [Candidatus Komeilibacteria bacterium]|nr:prenyltransferase/squalene oxidase repeat-containing protein [Candidatus Komeilibacteria bacterium]
MKKYILTILLCLLIILPPINKGQAQVPPAMGAYLAGIAGNDWVVMAQGAMGALPSDHAFLKTIDGSSANDYATYILAITAMGKDPRYFGSENLVASLRQKVSGGQLGDSTLVNDDMFGLLALISSGIPSSDSLIVNEVNYLKSKQLADGSWDFAANTTTGNVDMTAMGIMALRAGNIAANDPVLTKAVSYLALSQNNDGGWPMMAGSPSNTESTAWALSALYALGDSPNFWAPQNISPVDYLLAQIQGAGFAGFNSSSITSTARTPVTTAYAAIALAGKFYPVRTLSALKDVNLRVEGELSRICATSISARTALDAVQSAAAACNYTYHIQDTQYGPYLDKVNNETATGLIGWIFRVNNESLQVGAADYLVNANDNILLYYGNWDSLPPRLSDEADNIQQSLGLEVIIGSPVNSAVLSQSNSAVIFGVSGDLNFGTLIPGQTGSKVATLTNSGTANITTTASVSGADLFKNNLTLDSQAVPNWQKSLTSGASGTVNVSLSVPSNYASTGKEQGTLIFWANVVE